ncbi:hypothetical protein P3X46_010843 [Hevea brasiliensis]|uniref:Formamidopyrimidine-DNA glycosylase catalytic domain-containing protein n=1 Tax=Hevea brasiliensis TaxID=3981 RepID=A0ABQ9MGH2_HEVBR|nr:formamidopyrimidine-DNA glycosylase isoform X1 [Hevea brasiliensis]KAJ9179013.1 hypothetical protein P3X46_010843 [Hevea brasiliensis]
MPELPEVEAARRAIEEHCLGKRIKKAIIANDPKVIDGVSPSDFESALVGKTLISALRKGKNLWFLLDSPPFPSFQFGMAGAIYIKGVAVTKYKRSTVNDTDEWPSKYSKLFIELDDGLELSFTDKRRFAKVRLLKDPASVPPISELGPDALLEPMAVDEFYESLHKKKIAIKALLLDQSFISGIGNWIADEVLYQASIHPLQTASSLSKGSCATLHKCIKEVIEKAIEVGADSSQFPNNWIFHSREKKPGKAFVDGKKIDFIAAGGRTTAYVPELQKLSGGQAVKAAVKSKRQTPKRKKSDHDDDDDDDDEVKDDANKPGSEEEEAARKAKSTRELKPRGHVKKPPTKQISKASDDNDDEENDKGAAADDDDEIENGGADDDNDNDDEKDRKKKPSRVSNDKQAKAKKESNKKVTNQNSRRPKKKMK